MPATLSGAWAGHSSALGQVWAVAGAQWHYWCRSRLALAGLALFVVLACLCGLFTVSEVQQARETRQQQQHDAQALFSQQPNRHPHRMVHYGHYVFRTPPPLALFDPGLDAVTGQSLFLEGHRHNSASFAQAETRADLGNHSLTPAQLYQQLLPLLLILMGAGLVAREREAQTLLPLLAQGISPQTLVWGKALAMAALCGLLLVPMAALMLLAWHQGESAWACLSLLAAYGLYLLLWSALVVLAATACTTRAASLMALVATWLCCQWLLPALAVSLSAWQQPLAGKLERDLRMQAELRQAGDGHNTQDPAFTALRTQLLQEHGVSRVEDLPINLRGRVAEFAEARLTAVLNRYAEAHMAEERRQSAILSQAAWLSPQLAISLASRSLAASSLSEHQRFLREAEALRFDFVQSLNRLHASQLRYSDDQARSKDPDAEQRTRIDAAHWALLKPFHWQPQPWPARWQQAWPAVLALATWLGLASLGIGQAARRLRP
jgi:ABC-2 type transport system permease protein